VLVVRVSKIAKKKWSRTLKVTDTITITVSCEDSECSVIYNDKVVSRVEGLDFAEWCFEVEDYLVCLDKSDIVGG
jgi:hypothetical protein